MWWRPGYEWCGQWFRVFSSCTWDSGTGGWVGGDCGKFPERSAIRGLRARRAIIRRRTLIRRTEDLNMTQFSWEVARLAPDETGELWETFHENSKLSRFVEGIPADEVSRRMALMYESLPFESYPAVALPERAALAMSLGDA